MDAISYSYADKQAKRIKKFINDPDSTSGVLTVPKVIASGENVTIPAGRVAVLPNVQVDGTLNVEGEVFIPSGATFGDLESQIALKASTTDVNTALALKSDTSYVNTQLGLKQNVLVANDSAVKTALNATGNAPIYACRAWVNFNGTGTPSIRASGNVSSITDNGVGDYSINFISSMPSANYCVTGYAGRSSVGAILTGDSYGGNTVMKANIQTRLLGGSVDKVDADFVSIAIFV